jgi:hypothetical protein
VPDIWAHRSRMRSANDKSALDRGVVPHMGIPRPPKSAKVVLVLVAFSSTTGAHFEPS